jgi:site-specific DNA-cytosine methylase
MELAGVNVAAYLSCEVDEPAKRVVPYSWPTRTEVGSIRNLTGQKVAEFLEGFPRILLLLVVAGFPCKGMSASNIHGSGLRDKQSVLLFELVRLRAELR